MQTVTLSQNNSGGSFWLSESQVDALIADGWRIDPEPYSFRVNEGRHTFDLQLDVPVADEDAAVTIAQIEFQRVTGHNPNDIGCTCCGPPFNFDTWTDRWPDEVEHEVEVTITVKSSRNPAATVAAIEEAVAKLDFLSVENVD